MVNELDIYIILNDIDKMVKECKDNVKMLAVNECRKYQAKTFVHSNHTITFSEKKTWEYKHAKQWQEINNKLKELEGKMQSAAIHLLDTDSETGETITPAQYKISEVITIKKMT